jgi:hypothetical protein
VQRVRDVADRELEAGLERVEQRGLPDARWAGDDRQAAIELAAELLQTDPGLGARVDHAVADALVRLEELARRVDADEVDLVRDDDRGHLVVLRHDEKPVDQARVRRRVIACEDGHDKVGVCDHHVLAPRAARSWLPAAEPPLARLDGLDRAGAVGEDLELHAVADDREIRCLALLLHPAAEVRLDQRAVIGRHRVEARARAKHQPAGRGQPSAPTALP